jgi:hypothetical protein
MYVDRHEEIENFVLTYLQGEELEGSHLATITRKERSEDETGAVHYFPREQSPEISRYALTTFYRSKFSEGIDGYNEKRNLTSHGYELLSENIGNENQTERDVLVEEKGLEGAFNALEEGHPENDIPDSEKASKKFNHFY